MRDVSKGQEYTRIMDDLEKGIRYVVSARQGNNASGSFEGCLKTLIKKSAPKIIENESSIGKLDDVA